MLNAVGVPAGSARKTPLLKREVEDVGKELVSGGIRVVTESMMISRTVS